MTEFITYQQAIDTRQLQVVSQQHEERLKESLRTFSKNTMMQVLFRDLFRQGLELYNYYKQKDYSQYLFDKSKKYFEEFDLVNKELSDMEPKFAELSKLNCVELLKQKIQNKNGH